MNAVGLYTRKITGLDYRVWLSMLIMCLICLALLGYQKIKASSTITMTCATNLFITVNGKDANDDAVCYLNQITLFRINAAPGAKVEWNFGDGSDPVEGAIASHTFHSESSYTVQATIDGRCKYAQDIVVQLESVKATEITEIKIYADSNKIMAGTPLRFSCASKNIREETYQWMVLGTDQIQTTKIATFSFPAEGQYTVELMLNNDQTKKAYTKIEVAPIPQTNSINNNIPNPNVGGFDQLGPLIPPNGNPSATTGNSQQQGNAGSSAAQEPPKSEPTPPDIQEIDPSTFQSLLQNVLKGGEQIDALYPYLKYKGSTKIEVNGDMPYINLSEFCISKRGRKIKSLEFVKERENQKNIQIIKVKLRWRLI